MTFPTLGLLSLMLACDTSNPDLGGDDTGDVEPSEKSTTWLDGSVQGEASAAVTVESYRIQDDGSEEKKDSADVQSDGTFRLSIDVVNDGASDDTDDFALIKAFDADGQLVGQVLVEETGDEDEATSTTPIDAESTIEAIVWTKLVREKQDTDASNYADLRGRIDADVAVTVYAEAMDDQPDNDQDLDALTAAIEAALATELVAMAERGSDVESTYADEKQASLDLTAALYAIAQSDGSSQDVDDAEAEFNTALSAVFESVYSMDSEDCSEVSTQSWLAMVSTLEAMGSSDDTWNAAALMYGEAQALLSAEATSDTMSQTWSDSSVLAEVEAELETLVESADEAEDDGDVDAMAEAWQSFEAVLIGSAEPSDESITESILDLGLAGQVAYEDATQSADDANQQYLVDVQSIADAYAQHGDASLMAESMTQAWANYDDSVMSVSTELVSQLEGSLDLEDGASFFSSLFIQGAGSFTILD